MAEIIGLQKVGVSKFICLFDVLLGYHQFAVDKENHWLTSFICDDGQFPWTRTPVLNEVVRDNICERVKEILRQLRRFTKSCVDDMAVYSDSWEHHLQHITEYLTIIRASGFTLGIKKCKFAKSEIKFIGHVIGLGYRRADPDKVAAIEQLNNLKLRNKSVK